MDTLAVLSVSAVITPPVRMMMDGSASSRCLSW